MASVTRNIRRNLATRLAFRDVISSYNKSNCPPRFNGDIYRKHRAAVVRELVKENDLRKMLDAYRETRNPFFRLTAVKLARRQGLSLDEASALSSRATSA